MSEKSRRLLRVEREIREMASEFLIANASAGGFSSVTRVEASADLRLAKVFVSVLDGDVKEVVGQLQKRAHQLQRQINASLHMKYCPKISFLEDRSLHNVMKVESILRAIAVSKVRENPQTVPEV